MYTGPKITTDGLVFGYDTGYGISDNSATTRHNHGEPTTNLFNNDLSSFTETSTFPIVPPVISENGGSWDYMGWSGDIQLPSTYNIGDTISVSGYYLSYTTSSSLEWTPSAGIGIWSDVGRIDYIDVTNEWNTWSFFQHSFTVPSASVSQIRIEGRGYDYYNTASADSTSGHWCNVQIEENSHSTPFVSGSRSTTGSLLDLAGNNIIDIVSGSYDTDSQLTFNGSSTELVVQDTSILSFTDNIFTFDFWVYFDDTSSHGIIGKRNNWEYGIWIEAGIMRLFAWSTSGSNVYDMTYTVVAEKWYNFYWSADGSNVKLYENGVYKSQVSKNPSYTMGDSSGPIKFGVGGNSEGDRYLGGKLPIFKIYNRALSQKEVSQNFNSLKGRFGI